MPGAWPALFFLIWVKKISGTSELLTLQRVRRFTTSRLFHLTQLHLDPFLICPVAGTVLKAWLRFQGRIDAAHVVRDC